MDRHQNVLTREEIRDTKKYSIADGSASNVMYGFGEQYVTAFALQLGATSSEIGILASVPSFIGSIFQVVGAKLTEHYQNRKKVVLFFVLMQALMILPLFLVPFLTKSILLLTVIFSLYFIFTNISAPGWNSWIGAVIPDKERAEYFSKRNKTTITFLLISVLTAGIILNYFTKVNIWIGFGILFAISFLGRLASWYFLFRQFEPPYITKKEEAFSFKDFLKKLPETNFGNFVMFRSLMALSVMIASPFFAVYMLKDLQFSYFQYTIIVLAPMLIKVLTITYWGKYSRKLGTRNIMIVSAFLIAVIPLAWFLAGYFFFGHKIIFFLIMLAETISGFAWAGFDLSTFNYILETVSPGKRARCIAYFNILFGTAVLIGGLFGSWLVSSLPKEYYGVSLLLIVFIISAIARFIVPMIFASKLHEVKIHKNMAERKIFMDLVVSNPLHSAMDKTMQIMLFTEEGIKKVTKTTSQGLKLVKKPLEPVINHVINGLDKGLTKAENIRKIIESEKIRQMKKRDYEHLVNYDYEKYIRTGPATIKKVKNRPRKK
jgi:MFS family permease